MLLFSLMVSSISSIISTGILLLSYLSVAVYKILKCCKLIKPHWSACMKLLGGDSNLCSKSKLASVSKSCRGIYIYSSCVNFRLKFFSIFNIFSNNSFRMSCTVSVNMLNSFIYGINNLYRNYIVKKFCSIICF